MNPITKLRDAWAGPAGISEVLRMALPMAASSGCTTVALFVDRTLLHFHDPQAMAATMPGGTLFWTLVCFPIGMAGMTSAFVAQYIGSSRQEEVGRFMVQAIWFSIIVGSIYIGLYPLATQLFLWTGQEQTLVPLESLYFRSLLPCSIPIILDSALAGYFSGTQRPGLVLAVNLGSTVVNILLDFVLIFGYLGLPAWGIFGAGLATTLSVFLKVTCYGLLIMRGRERHLYGWSSIVRWIDRGLMGRFLLFSTPAGLQHLLESGTFLVIVLKIGQLEPAALAATTMAINFNMIAFVPLIGVSIAASVLVGHHLTRDGPELAWRATRSALAVSVSYAFVSAIVYLAAPHWLLELYFSSHLPVVNEQIAAEDTVVILLRFVAAYCIIDAVQLTLAGALRGAGDTWYVLLSSSACTATVLSCGWLLEPQEKGYLLYWWWIWMSTWVFLLGIFFGARVWQGRWLQCRLIGSQPQVSENVSKY